MKRSPLKRTTTLKRGTSTLKRTPFRPKSKRPRGVPTSVRNDVFARDRGCVAVLLVRDVRCSGPLDPHHVLRRSQGGTDTADNLLTLCRAHHRWVHEHPALSIEIGLLRKSS